MKFKLPSFNDLVIKFNTKIKKKVKYKKLKDLVVGDLVLCTGDSSFCDPSYEKVKKITIKYDDKFCNGNPYNVIWISGGQSFDSRNGSPLSPPLAYYIISREEDTIKMRLDKLKKIKK